MKKQYKGLIGEIKEVNDVDRTLVALVSTNDRDRMDEVLDPAGVDLENYRKNPVVLFAHNMHQPPIGRAIWIKQAAEGIISKVQFAKTQLADEIFQLYKNKFMRAFSVGFIPKETKEGDGLKEPRRTITKWELLEYSAVPVPANPNALQLALKSVKSEILKKELQVEEWGQKIEDAIIKGAKKEVKEEGTIEEIKILTAEYDTMKAHYEAEKTCLQQEIVGLKYTLYCLTATLEHQPNTLSEITDKGIVQIIDDTVSGVIRKVTGKV